MENNEQHTKSYVLQFIVQNTRLCMDLSYVEKILPMISIEKLPNGPNYLVGIINYYGNILPIIDLALRIGLKRETNYTIDTPIILCTSKNQQMGIIVDSILGLEHVEHSSTTINKEFEIAASFIEEINHVNDEVLLKLNMDAILLNNILSTGNLPVHDKCNQLNGLIK